MVLLVHCCEPFYLGGPGAYIASLGLPTVGVICLGAVMTYTICGAITWVLSFIPKSKYIIG